MSEAIAALAGVVLAGGFSLAQYWLTGRRDDKIRREQEAKERVRYERDMVGELLVGLHLWVNSVENRKFALNQHRQGRGEINAERFQKYLADEETFRAILARARVSIRNPQARPHIDALRNQLLIMSRLMNAATDGYGFSSLESRFETFQGVAG